MAYKIYLLWIIISTEKLTNCVHLISSSSPSEVREGNPFNLTCQISSPILGCNWLRSRDSVTMTLTSSYHYVISGNNSNGECSLFIKQASVRDDDGRWRCVLTVVNETTVSTDVKLRVLPQVEKFVPVANSFNVRPGVIVGSLCTIIFTLGGLITIYFYNSKNSCCLAPPGFSSRSMLIRSNSSQLSERVDEPENRTRLI